MGRRRRFIELMEGSLNADHPALAELVKQCLHNVPYERPNAEELLTRLQGMRAEIEGGYGSSPITLDMVRLRLAKEIKVKEQRIEVLTQQQASSRISCNIQWNPSITEGFQGFQ